MDKITGLMELLGEENNKKIKDKVTQFIIDAIEDDIHDYNRDSYILNPEEIIDFVNECKEEAFKRVNEISNRWTISSVLWGDKMRKIEGMKNGYIINNSSTNEEWQDVCKRYDKVNCIICNNKTAKHFRLGLFANNIITVNNKLLDDVVYINGVYWGVIKKEGE